MKTNKFALLFFLITLILILSACSGEKTNESGSSEIDGSKNIKVALQGIPPSLDPHITGSTMTMEIARPIYETLVVYDNEYEVQPMLAKEWEISEDQKSIIFKLREGIKFHNGEEMTAKDVVASMNRWRDLHDTSKRILGEFEFDEVDEYEVVMKLKEPSFVALDILAIPPQFPAIMPKSIIDVASEQGVEEYIGTGPFKLKEYQSDQHAEYEKFDDYEPVEGEQNGLAGEKIALVDTVFVDFVSDDSTRVSSLLTGEYNLANSLPYDNFDELDADENVDPFTFEAGTDYIIFNKKQGPFKQKTARQAILVGLDNVALSNGVYSADDFYNLNPSLSLKDQVNWYTEEGNELYNQNDKVKAKNLLDESGYDGEEITILTSDSTSHHNTAISLQQQLEEMGVKATIDSYEFATALEYREDPDNWDIYIVDLGTETLPINYLYFNPSWAGWTESPEIEEAVNNIKYADNQEEATEAVKDLQDAFYDYVPVLKPSDRLILGASNGIEGTSNFANGNIYWGVSIK